MPATIEQAMSNPTTPTTATMPKIMHDAPNQAVYIDVVVSLNPDGQDITISAAPTAIPQKVWTLRWNLVVTTPELRAEFTDPGILIDPGLLPPKVSIAGAVDQEDHCIREVTNYVAGANQFGYLISVNWYKGNSSLPTRKTIHDPTIAVTQDPVGWITPPAG
jgi:hypothetical protein